jgi:zinc protease
LEDVRAVANKYLAPERMITVAVGDRAKIEPELTRLGLGAIEVRDADGSVKRE